MIHQTGESKQPIIIIMLNRGGLPYPTLPPTHFFSVNDPLHPLCPLKF